MESIDKLMNVVEFRKTFSGGKEATEGFYAFENQMMERTAEFEELVLNLRILSSHFNYILTNYQIKEQKTFDYLKGLEMFLIRLQFSKAGYDESKPLCRFIWDVFAGWSFVSGARDYDIIEKAISEL
jgi:hypothetical protein